jgi:hypothetical protein
VNKIRTTGDTHETHTGGFAVFRTREEDAALILEVGEQGRMRIRDGSVDWQLQKIKKTRVKMVHR